MIPLELPGAPRSPQTRNAAAVLRGHSVGARGKSAQTEAGIGNVEGVGFRGLGLKGLGFGSIGN